MNNNQQQLIEEYGQLVSSLCRRMLSDPAAAQDAAQEVWIEVLKSLPTFRGEAKLSTWLYKIAYRVISRQAKKEKLNNARELRTAFRENEKFESELAGPERKLWVKEMCNKCLNAILHCLSNESRIIYIFREIIRLSYEEIADIVEKDSSAIRKALSRAKEKLNNFLNDECYLYNPAGSCSCRMRNLVVEIDLKGEYEKLKGYVAKANLFLQSEEVLPRKNYWIKNL